MFLPTKTTSPHKRLLWVERTGNSNTDFFWNALLRLLVNVLYHGGEETCTLVTLLSEIMNQINSYT